MKVPVSDGEFATYVARPATGPAPTIVVLQEIFGVNADIRATCDELAGHGFIAIAPDLFWRKAPGLDLNSWSDDDWKQGLELYQEFDLELGVQDIAATLQAARAMAGATGKVGVMGFCLGGLMAYLTTAQAPADAAVAYYGGNTDQHLQVARNVTTPLLMHLGEEDEFISTQAQQKIAKAFDGMPNVAIISYPMCSHAFARHTGTHYNQAAAQKANARTLAFFDQHLR
jgi:carboxymethylenebutenolidase